MMGRQAEDSYPDVGSIELKSTTRETLEMVWRSHSGAAVLRDEQFTGPKIRRLAKRALQGDRSEHYTLAKVFEHFSAHPGVVPDVRFRMAAAADDLFRASASYGHMVIDHLEKKAAKAKKKAQPAELEKSKSLSDVKLDEHGKLLQRFYL